MTGNFETTGCVPVSRVLTAGGPQYQVSRPITSSPRAGPRSAPAAVLAPPRAHRPQSEPDGGGPSRVRARVLGPRY
jgi:hypothetical protein